MEARYPGTCAECGGRIRVGQQIVGSSEGFVHEECEAQPDDIIGTQVETCQQCWLVHPKGACDRG